MEVISTYTAAQAVEDGFLVEVPEDWSKEAGINIPVRLSSSVHEFCTPPASNKIQSYRGRVHDVLWLARFAIARSKDDNMTEFVVKIGRKNHRLWACLDGTSGVAIHIITPEEY